MSTENYFQVFKCAIARIYNKQGKVVGAGFLVTQYHILTCAHVITAALSIVTNTQDSPTETIEVDFPLIAPGQKVKANVAFWQPVNPGQSKEDIAGLQIDDTLPTGVSPVKLVTTSDYWQHKFRIFGFPQGHDTGVWADGELRDIQATGWIQIEAIKVPGYQIEPGFSGSPVWDESLQGVVGMAVAAEKKREGVKAAFMMPTTVLVETWDFLNQAIQQKTINSSPSLSRVQEIKTKELNKRLVILESDYEAVYNQLNYTENAESRNNLQRQLNRIEQDMVEISKSLTPSTNTNRDFTKKPIPQLLLYLCDRTEQKSQIEFAYNDFKKKNSYRSLVFIIHGDEKQSHESFLRRMKEDILPHSLESMSCNFREHFLEWPAKFKPLNNDELQTRLLKDLYQKIFKHPSVDEDKLKNYFVKSSNEELIFYTSLTTKNWQEQGFKILDNLLNFWRSLFNENIIQKELIIVIFIKYKNQGKKSNIIEWIKSILNLKNNHRTNKKIRNHLDLLKKDNNKSNDFLIIPVDELESVTKEEVDDWTNYDEVRDVINQAKFHQLKLEINNIFENSSKSKDSIPMIELENYLFKLLEDLT